MKVLDKGHVYELANRTPGGLTPAETTTLVQFVNCEPGKEVEGVTTQEILRMLIDRTRYCNNCLPHQVNERIIYHFRMALALHEGRALEQKVKRGWPIEIADVNYDGHLVHEKRHPLDAGKQTLTLTPWEPESADHCNYAESKPSTPVAGEVMDREGYVSSRPPD